MLITSHAMLRKGMPIVMIGRHDDRGTVVATPWTIASVGKKQIYLTSPAGNAKFRLWSSHLAEPRTFFRLITTDNVESDAMQVAADWNDILVADLHRCIAHNAGDEHAGYRAHLHRELDAMHEPRVIHRLPE